MFVIPDELRSFIESGVAVVAATADSEGRPHVAFAWGTHVLEGGTRVAVCLESSRAEQVIEDAREGTAIAVTFGHPTTYRSVQLKGTTRTATAAGPHDEARAAAHQGDFLSATALVGDDPSTIRSCWSGQESLLRLEFDVERAFDQTPGPGAGREL